MLVCIRATSLIVERWAECPLMSRDFSFLGFAPARRTIAPANSGLRRLREIDKVYRNDRKLAGSFGPNQAAEMARSMAAANSEQ